MKLDLFPREAKRDPQTPALSRNLERPHLFSSLTASAPGLDPNKAQEVWDGLLNGDFEPDVRCWHGLAGVREVLDSWRRDYGIWQANALAEDQDARLTWLRQVQSGNWSAPPIHWPCKILPRWEEDRTWLSLLPAPGFGLGAYPALTEWKAAPQGQRLMGEMEVFLLGAHPEHPTLWAPLSEDLREALLRQAHMQRAMFQIFP